MLSILSVVSATSALAQGTSAIAGVVTDTTGASLPGVSVEARSPVLIEQSRSAVTDTEGRYRLIDLLPGVYEVRFSLTGFNSVVRPGIELQANFTAPLNVQMRVGTIEETVTVQGSSPIVDVQRSERRDVVTQELADALPTGRSFSTIGNTIPALVQQGAGAGGVTGSLFDVGGSSTMWQAELHVYAGPAPQSTEVDGMRIDSFINTGVTAMYGNSGAFEQFVYQVNAGAAETPYGNVVVNQIPHSGSNAVHVFGVGNWANSSLSAGNASPDQLSAGFQLQTQPKLDLEYDINPSIGFPILRDRVWWFSSFRAWTYNATTGALSNGFHQPAGTPEVDRNLHRAITNRATIAASPKTQFNVLYEWIRFERYGAGSPTAAPEAVTLYNDYLDYFGVGKWTYTPTSKLFVEAGYSVNHKGYANLYQPGVPVGAPAKQDVVLNYSSGNIATAFSQPVVKQFYNTALTYVTGRHQLKFGFQGGYGFDRLNRYSTNGNLLQQYRNGVPFGVVIYDTPINSEVAGREAGLFAQDSWTFKRLTLNPGIRWDSYFGKIDAVSAPATTFLPARNFPEVDNLPYWRDVSLRFGAAYDVFGNGKTAVKGAVGKYLQGQTAAASFITPYNPVSSGITLVSDSRNWKDLNGDGIAEPNEIGPSNNPGFGISTTRKLDPNANRPYDLLYNISIDQELMPGLGLSVAYNRRAGRNLLYSENLANPLSTDWQQFSIANPIDPSQTLPVYQVIPSKVTGANLLDVSSDQNTRVYNGIDVLVTGRFHNGLTFTGGSSTGRLITDTCQQSNPNNLNSSGANPTNPGLLYCDQSQYSIPFLTTYKLSGTYPLPWYGLRVSAVFQTQPGPERFVYYTVTRAQLPQLTTAPSVAVQLNAPGTVYFPRIYQTDLSAAWAVTVRKLKVRPSVDLFNSFNTNNVLSETNQYPTQGRPLSILPGRLLRLSMRVDF